MVGWLKKEFVSCPRCRSSWVEVPWSLGRDRQRVLLGRAFLGLLGAGAVFGLTRLFVREAWVWVGAALCLTLVALPAVGYHRSLTVYRCLDCQDQWRARRQATNDP